jgi:hypothetical protein
VGLKGGDEAVGFGRETGWKTKKPDFVGSPALVCF